MDDNEESQDSPNTQSQLKSTSRMSKLPEDEAEEAYQRRRKSLLNQLTSSKKKRPASEAAKSGKLMKSKSVQKPLSNFPKTKTTEKMVRLINKASRIESEVRKVQGRNDESNTKSATIQGPEITAYPNEAELYKDIKELDSRLQAHSNGCQTSRGINKSAILCPTFFHTKQSITSTSVDKHSFLQNHSASRSDQTSFPPTVYQEIISARSKLGNTQKIENNSSNQISTQSLNIADRSTIWLQKREEKRQKSRKLQDEKSRSGCTFWPSTIQTPILKTLKMPTASFLERNITWSSKREISIKTQRVFLSTQI